VRIISTIEVDADTSKAEAKLDQFDQKQRKAMSAFATNIRRTAEVGLYMAEAFGVVIDVVLRLAIEASLRTIEFITAAFAVESIATLGIAGALRLGAQAAAVSLMYYQIILLTRQRNESARQIGKVVNGIRVLTF